MWEARGQTTARPGVLCQGVVVASESRDGYLAGVVLYALLAFFEVGVVAVVCVCCGLWCFLVLCCGVVCYVVVVCVVCNVCVVMLWCGLFVLLWCVLCVMCVLLCCGVVCLCCCGVCCV